MDVSKPTLAVVKKVHDRQEITTKERLRIEAEIVRLLKKGGVPSGDAVNLVLAHSWASFELGFEASEEWNKQKGK